MTARAKEADAGSQPQDSYAEWSILELLGHRRLAGFVTEQEIAGKGFLRIDIPTKDGSRVTQFYSPEAVYGLTPTTKTVAESVAISASPAPVQPWELKRLAPGDEDGDDDDRGLYR